MLKLKFLKGMSGKEVYKVGKPYDFEDKEAIRLINAGIAEPTNKKAFAEAVAKLEEEAQLQKEKEEQAAAILHKEELEAERAKLQVRVDDITNSLCDGAEYYKSYIALAEDLIKKGESNDGSNNDSKKDGISQGE